MGQLGGLLHLPDPRLPFDVVAGIHLYTPAQRVETLSRAECSGIVAGGGGILPVFYLSSFIPTPG